MINHKCQVYFLDIIHTFANEFWSWIAIRFCTSCFYIYRMRNLWSCLINLKSNCSFIITHFAQIGQKIKFLWKNRVPRGKNRVSRFSAKSSFPRNQKISLQCTPCKKYRTNGFNWGHAVQSITKFNLWRGTPRDCPLKCLGRNWNPPRYYFFRHVKSMTPDF